MSGGFELYLFHINSLIIITIGKADFNYFLQFLRKFCNKIALKKTDFHYCRILVSIIIKAEKSQLKLSHCRHYIVKNLIEGSSAAGMASYNICLTFFSLCKSCAHHLV